MNSNPFGRLARSLAARPSRPAFTHAVVGLTAGFTLASTNGPSSTEAKKGLGHKIEKPSKSKGVSPSHLSV
jgi:hypothetical protein